KTRFAALGAPAQAEPERTVEGQSQAQASTVLRRTRASSRRTTLPGHPTAAKVITPRSDRIQVARPASRSAQRAKRDATAGSRPSRPALGGASHPLQRTHAR